MPKGVLWRQEDIFFAALAPRSVPPRIDGSSSAREAARARARCPRRRSCTAPRTGSRSACGTWAARSSCSRRPSRLDPTTSGRRSSASSVERAHDRRRRLRAARSSTQLPRSALRPLARCRLLTSGGAILSAAAKEELLGRFPGMTHPRRLGSSETGAAGDAGDAAGGTRDAPATSCSPTTTASSTTTSPASVAPGSGDERLARAARRRAARLPRRRREDARAPSRSIGRRPLLGPRRPRGRRRRTAGSRLLGRDSVTINSGGEKIFAEEVEHALKHHPRVYDAVVVGTPNERWGQQVTALVAAARRRDAPTRLAAARRVREHIAALQAARAPSSSCRRSLRAPSGKADYRWASAEA